MQCWFQFLSFIKRVQRSIKKYGVAFGGQFALSFATKYKLLEMSILSLNKFTIMIYFLTFVATLVSVPKFCKKDPKVHQKAWGCLWWPNIQPLAIKERKLFESSALSQNRFILMIYFLMFIAMLVSVPQFYKKDPKVHRKVWGCLWWLIYSTSSN